MFAVRPEFQAGLWLQSALSTAFSAPTSDATLPGVQPAAERELHCFPEHGHPPLCQPNRCSSCWPGTCFLQGQNSPQGSAQSVVPTGSRPSAENPGPSGAREGLLTSQECLPCRPQAAMGSLLAPSSCLRPGPGLPGCPRAILVTQSRGRFHSAQPTRFKERKRVTAGRSSAESGPSHSPRHKPTQSSSLQGWKPVLPVTNPSDWQRVIKMEQGFT